MSVAAMLLRAALVFGLLAVTLWLIKRGTGGLKVGRRSTPLQVLGSAKLGKGAAVAVVRIGEANYALGVTDHQVTLLTESPMAEVPEAAALPAGSEAPAALTAAAAGPLAAVSGGKAFLDAFLANLKNNARTVAGRRTKRDAVTPSVAAAAPAVEVPAIEAAPTATAPTTPAPAATFAELLAEADERDDVVLTLPDAPAVPAQRVPAVHLPETDEDVDAELVDEPVADAFAAAQVAATAAALDARLARRIGARLGSLPAPALAMATDGSAAYPAPRARARAARRTDAVSRNEEHPWSTSCRTSGRVERFRRSPF